MGRIRGSEQEHLRHSSQARCLGTPSGAGGGTEGFMAEDGDNLQRRVDVDIVSVLNVEFDQQAA